MAPDWNMIMLLSFAMFLGQFTRGATGFGSAIVYQVVLVIFHMCGLTVGEMRTAVVSESIASYFVVVYLFLFHLDRKDVAWSITLSVTSLNLVSSPLGAYLLRVLDQRTLQLVVGSVLSAVFVKDAVQRSWSFARRRGHKREASIDEDDDLELLELAKPKSDGLPFSIGATPSTPSAPPPPPPPVADPPSGEVVSSNLTNPVAPSSPSRNSAGSVSGSGIIALKVVPFLSSTFGPDWCRDLSLGALAGLLSGLIGGMTGIGGPPVFILLQYLNYESKVVVTTGAMFTVLGPRPFVYAVMGNMRVDEIVLYAVVVLSGLIGAASGMKAVCTEQERLKVALSFLVLLGAILMFVAAGDTRVASE